MYNKNNPNYMLYLSGIITENQYYDILEKNQESKKIPLRENESIELVPRNELEKYYLDVLKKRSWGHFGTIAMYGFNPSQMWSIFYKDFYDQLRKADDDYYKAVPHDNDIIDYTSKGNNLVEVRNENGWHFRKALSMSKHPRIAYKIPKEEQERVSFAAIANKKLIDILDDYVANKRLAIYKTPADGVIWLERHDPMTMYFLEEITPEVKKELKDIFNNKDFNRSFHAKNPLEGDEFFSGVAREKTPTQKEIEKLLGDVKSIDMDAYKILYENYLEKGANPPRFKVSSGMFQSGKKVKELCEKHLDKITAKDLSKSIKFHLSDIAKKITDEKWQEIYGYWEKSSDPKLRKEFGTALINSAMDKNQLNRIWNAKDVHLEKYITLFDLGKNVKDPKWHKLYDSFLKSKDTTLQKALKQAAQTGDMKYIQGY